MNGIFETTTVTEIVNFREDMDDVLLRCIGVVFIALHIMFISFNLLLAYIIFRTRHENFHNPFYKTAVHLVICEVLLLLCRLILMGTMLVAGQHLTEVYYTYRDQLFVPNSIMLTVHTCYYFLQLFIAIYRFLSVNSSSAFAKVFESNLVHICAGFIWVYSIGQGVFMAEGECTNLYRPRYHYVGAYCNDTVDLESGPLPMRWYMLLGIQITNVSLPILSMLIYIALYFKICFYQVSSIIHVRSSIQADGTKKTPSVTQRFRMICSKEMDNNNKQQIRIIYQGIILVFLLSVEPCVNFVLRFFSRPYKNPYFIVFSYALYILSCFPNFFIFFVFNSQMRVQLKKTLYMWSHCRMRSAFPSQTATFANTTAAGNSTRNS